jgi:hypothetical protein
LDDDHYTLPSFLASFTPILFLTFICSVMEYSDKGTVAGLYICGALYVLVGMRVYWDSFTRTPRTG